MITDLLMIRLQMTVSASNVPVHCNVYQSVFCYYPGVTPGQAGVVHSRVPDESTIGMMKGGHDIRYNYHAVSHQTLYVKVI